MPLTKEQQHLVELNMGLVGTVIKECVRNPSKAGIFTCEDLFQFGCIGLCNAAMTYRAGGRANFDTYAYILIRNHIFHKLEYATLRSKREQICDPDELPDATRNDLMETIGFETLDSVLDSAAAATSGIVSKGITAIRMQAQGLSCKEIGDHFGGVTANNVTAWISKARKHLKSVSEIAELAP